MVAKDSLRSTFLNPQMKGFDGVAKDFDREKGRGLSMLYRTIRNEKSHTPHAERKTLDKLQLLYPCEIVFFSKNNEERLGVNSEEDFLNTLREGPSQELQNEGYQLTINERKE